MAEWTGLCKIVFFVAGTHQPAEFPPYRNIPCKEAVRLVVDGLWPTTDLIYGVVQPEDGKP